MEPKQNKASRVKHDTFVDSDKLTLEIPKKNWEWLNAAVIGRLFDQRRTSEFMKVLVVEENIACQLSPMGGNSFCLMFNLIEDRDLFVGKTETIAGDFLEDFYCWDKNDIEHEVVICVLIEDIPLQCRNTSFFGSVVRSCWLMQRNVGVHPSFV